MNQEELQKALEAIGKGGIQVAGDLVLEKHVEYEVNNVQVYWLDFDHYDGSFRVPESWTLYYQDANGNWVEVEDHSPLTVKKDCYNSVDFKPVRTKGLKILAKLQQGQSGGVLEWKVNGK
jgi:hypothetical protein